MQRSDLDVQTTVRFVGEALAFALPLALYIATASGHGYFLDAGELVAAATDLGISHPPGHPLSGLVTYLATLLPFGPLAFRVALASGVFAAIGALFFHRALVHTVEAIGVRSALLSVPLSLSGTLLLASCAGYLMQAVRPEVYALQAALLFAIIERLVALERFGPGGDHAAMYDAALCFGLALANHHFLAFLLLPAAAPTLARVAVTRGMRPLAIGAGLSLVGLSTYAYLPLRAAAAPFLALGAPTTPSRFYWVISAEAFQQTHDIEPAPLVERVLDVVVQLGLSLGPAAPFLALGGAYLMLRGPTSRGIGGLWLGVALVFVAARAWLGFIRDNPDALGYLMPAFGAVIALAVGLLAVVFGLMAGRDPARPRAFVVALAFALPLLALYGGKASASETSLAGFYATDALSDPVRRDLPTGAVLLAHDPQTIFHYLGGAAEEHLRPDLTLVPIPLLGYPGMVTKLSDAHPELREVLRGYLLHGELRQPDLQSLAAQRPLLIEMDPRVPPALYETMVPAGLYHAVLPDGATQADEAHGRGTRDAVLAALEADLPPPGARDHATEERLVWLHYTGALYYAGYGDLEAALAATRRGLAINSFDRQLRGLGAALVQAQASESSGPLDVTPFVLR
jgi:hypothetical protein